MDEASMLMQNAEGKEIVCFQRILSSRVSAPINQNVQYSDS